VRRLPELAGRAVASLPGILAIGCAVTGVYLLAGTAWALIAAVPFLLILDWRVAK
jgi:hypothetical protein